MTLAWAFDIWTYAIVGIVALLLFGNRLPEVGRSLGRGIAEFKKGLRDVQDEMSQESKREDAARPKLRPPEPPPEQTPGRQLPSEPTAPPPPPNQGADQPH